MRSGTDGARTVGRPRCLVTCSPPSPAAADCRRAARTCCPRPVSPAARGETVSPFPKHGASRSRNPPREPVVLRPNNPPIVGQREAIASSIAQATAFGACRLERRLAEPVDERLPPWRRRSRARRPASARRARRRSPRQRRSGAPSGPGSPSAYAISRAPRGSRRPPRGSRPRSRPRGSRGRARRPLPARPEREVDPGDVVLDQDDVLVAVHVPVDGERLLAQRPSLLVVALHAGDGAHVADHVGQPAAVAELAEEAGRSPRRARAHARSSPSPTATLPSSPTILAVPVGSPTSRKSPSASVQASFDRS